MKTYFLILILSILSHFNTLNAQAAAIKGGAISLPTSESAFKIMDIGFEYYFKKHWSVQLSYTRSLKERYDNSPYSKRESFLSPQLRYYFKENTYRKSFYMGLVVQWHQQNLTQELRDAYIPPFPSQKTDFDKLGLGIMGGFQIPIYKNLGIDAHYGYLLQMGTEYRVFTHEMIQAFSQISGINMRPFYTLNLYWLIGK